MYEQLCVKQKRNFVQILECVPMKGTKLIWLALPHMLKCKLFFTTKN
jgi:hypothetical protein